jgi:hypothetical protein
VWQIEDREVKSAEMTVNIWMEGYRKAGADPEIFNGSQFPVGTTDDNR